MTPTNTTERKPKADKPAATTDAPKTPRAKLTPEQKAQARLDKRLAAIAGRGGKRNDYSLERKFNPIWKEREAIAKAIDLAIAIVEQVDVVNQSENTTKSEIKDRLLHHRNELLAAMRGVRCV